MNIIPSTIIVFIVAIIFVCSSQINLDECQKTKICVFISPECEQAGDCEKIISYAAQPDDWVTIELLYNTTHPDTNYAAVGFSNDTQMGEEIVIHCGIGEMNEVGVFLSQNDGKHNRPLNSMIENSTKYVELLELSHTSDSIYCKFRQKITPESQLTYLPNLNHTYHLLLAYGTTSKYDELDIHSLDERSKDFPSFTSTPINVALLQKISLEPTKPTQLPSNRKLVVLHGILMLFGWISMIPSAIAAARYLREHWPETKPFGLKIWFHLHRTINYLAAIIAIAAVLSIFIGKKWRWTGPSIDNTLQRNLSVGSLHSTAGAVVIILMIIQVVGALLRCDQGSKYRNIFNFLHRAIGLLTFLLSQITIILSIFFRAWIARWAAAIIYALYVIITILLLYSIRKIIQKGHQSTSVTYGGQYYHEAQIVITKPKDDIKARGLTARFVLTFVLTSVIITVIMSAMLIAKCC